LLELAMGVGVGTAAADRAGTVVIPAATLACTGISVFAAQPLKADTMSRIRKRAFNLYMF
jgi:hypothetical protein